MSWRIVCLTILWFTIGSGGAAAREIRPWESKISLRPSQEKQQSALSDIFLSEHGRWRASILTTVFWIGEPAGGEAGGRCNRDSAWDMRWVERYGGTDHPRNRNGFHPGGFTPKQNPFYVALPFNDLLATIPTDHPLIRPFIQIWKSLPRTHRSVCKNRWIEIRYKQRTCFAQWQDVGPLYTDDFQYVFGNKAPRSHARGMAGLDISPAVRDYLGFPGSGRMDWKFVTHDDVLTGPWKEIVTID